MSDRPMIEIKNIYKQFGSVRALNGVSLNIYPGKVMVIIGPSGSGKSTLLRCMNHMEVEDQGEVWVDGDHLNGNQAHLNRIRSEMGMVFQLFQSLSTSDCFGKYHPCATDCQKDLKTGSAGKRHEPAYPGGNCPRKQMFTRKNFPVGNNNVWQSPVRSR